MAFKPNYQQERSARNRSKEQKKQEKLRRLQEGSERRKDGPGEGDAPEAETGAPPSDNKVE